MKQEWMLDLLTDIRECALKSGMFALAEQLEDSIMIAASEIRDATCCDGVVGTDSFGEQNNAILRRPAEREHP